MSYTSHLTGGDLMIDLLVTAVPLGTAAFLVVACCLLARSTEPQLDLRSRTHARPMLPRVPAQPGPPDARTSTTPGAAP